MPKSDAPERSNRVKILQRRQFGNPVLRKETHILLPDEIESSEIVQLIADMKHTLKVRKYGVGLAAPQVGRDIAISVIGIKPTPTRPELKKQNLVIINPKIVKTFGKKTAMWEGCISGPELYAQVPRYKKVRLRWHDEKGRVHEKDFDGFMAHVIQHEVDHLNGILFVDRVVDTNSYMTFTEYKKMKKKENGGLV